MRTATRSSRCTWRRSIPTPHTTLAVGVAVVRNGRIEAVLRSSRGTVFTANASPEPPRCELEFRTATGRTLLKELSPGGSLKLRARRFDPIDGGDHRVTASFESD